MSPKFLALSIALWLFSSIAKGLNLELGERRYLAELRTTKMFCFSSVNGMQVLDNLMTSTGTVSAGHDISSILENGENTLSIKVAGLSAPQDLTLTSDAACDFSIVAYPTNDEHKVVSVNADADRSGKPTGQNTPIYKGNEFVGSVSEATVTNSVLYEIKRTFVAKGLPEWAWVSSTPFNDTEQNQKKLTDRYLELWRLLSRKDIKALGKESEIAMRENGSIQGYSAEEFWQFYDFEKDFDDGFTAKPIDWSMYKFVSYRGGRLFRFEDGDGHSPLQIWKEGEGFISYNPYFSLINGKLVITR